MNQRKNPLYDTVNSTYFCIILFESGQHITGYSLKIGYTEPQNRETTLLNMFLRFYKTGYMRPGTFYNTKGNLIEPVEKMEFYDNKTGGLVYTFHPNFAEPEFDSDLSVRFMEKVEEMYADINKSMSFTDIYAKYYVSRTRKQKPKYLLDQPRFASMSSLNNYCSKLVKDGEPRGEVTHFRENYVSRWFGDDGRLNHEAVKAYRHQQKRISHAKEVSSDPVYEGKMKNAINKMSSRFNQ